MPQPRDLMRFVMFCVVAMALPRFAAAQVLEGEWADRAEQRIDARRKTDVRVIVVDRDDRPVNEAAVRIEQLRHDFAIGFTPRHEAGLDFDDAQRVWRTFNSVALDHFTDWPRLAGDDAEAQWDELDGLIGSARGRGLGVRLGGIISADAGRNPDALIGMDDAAAREAIEAHVGEVLRRFAWQVDQLDLYAQAGDHDWLEQRFGEPMLRRLFERARAEPARRPMVGVRFDDRLANDRLQDMVAQVTGWREAFVPVDVVAIEQRVRSGLRPGPIERALAWLDEMHVAVVFVGLEVGGESGAAAAVNLEMLMRLAFGSEAVQGVWLGGLEPGDVIAPHAALFDERGRLTRAGELFDALFAERWWSDETRRTDELGNAKARVFAGTYRITAVLDDGETLTTTVHLPRAEDERIVVLQPMRR